MKPYGQRRKIRGGTPHGDRCAICKPDDNFSKTRERRSCLREAWNDAEEYRSFPYYPFLGPRACG